MTTVGFIGLGTMGLPMAENLVKAGYNVLGFNRSPAKVEELVAAGGRAASSIAECVSNADVVAIMVPDGPDVEAVTTADDGVFANAPHGILVIDFSTIRPGVSRSVGLAAAAAGLRFLDAPVSGGEQGAISGTLAIMVGGIATDFDDAMPVFEAVGKTIVHVGPSGSGQVVKAANQLLVAGIIELVAEAIVLIEKSGVDIDAALSVLRGGLAGNAILDRKAAAMVQRKFDPGFRLELHHKDLGIVQDTARKASAAIPLGSLVAQLVGSSVAQGNGALDHSALLLLVEQLSGAGDGAAEAHPTPGGST